MSHKNAKSSQTPSTVKPVTINLQTRPFAPLEEPQVESSSQEQAEEFPKKQIFSENLLERLINTPTPESATPVQRKPEHRFKALRQLAIQAKLNIGEPNDKYEKEADETAAKVVQQINTPSQGQSVQRQESMEEEDELQMKSDVPILQRQESMQEEDELQMKSLIQRREDVGGGVASTDLESSIQSARGSGQSLDGSLSEKLGQAMGADFSGVKVHTDSQSDQLNKSIQAKAFTTGQDVFFRQGAYDPSSRGGQELIAHELTHVVQQNGGAVQRKSSIQRDPALKEDELQLQSISTGSLIGVRPSIFDLQMKPLTTHLQRDVMGDAVNSENHNHFVRQNFVISSQYGLLKPKISASAQIPSIQAAMQEGYATEVAQLHNVDEKGVDKGTIAGGSKTKVGDGIKADPDDQKGSGAWIKSEFKGKNGYLRRTKVFLFSDVKNPQKPAMEDNEPEAFKAVYENASSSLDNVSQGLEKAKLANTAKGGLDLYAGEIDGLVGLMAMAKTGKNICDSKDKWNTLKETGSFVESGVAKSASGFSKMIDSGAKLLGHENGVGASGMAANVTSTIADGLGSLKSAALGVIGLYKIYVAQSADRPKLAAETFKNLCESAASAAKVAKTTYDIMGKAIPGGLAYTIPGLSIAVAAINLLMRLSDALVAGSTSQDMSKEADTLRPEVATNLGVENPTLEAPGKGFDLDRRGTFPSYKTYFRVKGAIRNAIATIYGIADEASKRLETKPQNLHDEKLIVSNVINTEALPDVVKGKLNKPFADAKSKEEFKKSVDSVKSIEDSVKKYEFLDKMAEINQKRKTSGWTDVALELVNIAGDIVTIATSASGVGALVGQGMKAATVAYKSGHGAAKFVQGIHRNRTGSNKSASNKHKEYCQHAQFIYSQIANLKPTDDPRTVASYIEATGMGLTEFMGLASTPDKQVEALVSAMKKRS